MRQLASIQTIKSVEPIEGADRIELCHVLGWQCVSKKGEFKEGDLCVYFEIDSFLPIREEFEFLRGNSYKKTDLMGEGFRLKTQTFRGKISQGLVLPISILGDYASNVEVGQDVSDYLGVRKYEAQEMSTSAGDAIGSLPAMVPHTDETRIQAYPELLDEFKGVPYYITTKIDGTSCSVCYNVEEDEFRVTGHSVELRPNENCGFYKTILEPMNIQDKLKRYCDTNKGVYRIVIQGEYAGPDIQKNRLQLKEYKWFVFDIRINDVRVPKDRLVDIANELGLTLVPIEETGDDLTVTYPTVEALLTRAEGNYPCGGRKEGIVIRPTVPKFCSILNTDLSIKVINNKYLLKNDD